MTDDVTNGSVETGTPAAAQSAVLGNEGSKTETASNDPFVGLDEDTRGWVGAKGIKDIASLAKSARNAEQMIGKSVVLPGDDAKPEDWAKVWDRLGRPEKPEGYELAPPEGMPESMPYDQGFADWFKSEAHKANATKGQAKSIHDAFVVMSVERATKDAQARVDKANADLASAWGAKDSDQFKENLVLADRGIKTLGGDALMSSLKANGLIGPSGEILDATIAVAFAKAGKSLGTEGQFVSGNAATADNPFMPGKENITQQMLSWKTDPNKARMQMAAAGKSPRDFGLPG